MMSRAGKSNCVRLKSLIAISAILFPASILVAQAQEGGMAADITHCESVLKGQSAPEGAAEDRVKNLERDIFGKTSHGPLDKRLKKIHEALGIDRATPTATVPDASGVKPPEASAPAKTAAEPVPLPTTGALSTTAPPSFSSLAATAPEKAAPGHNALTTKQLLQLGTQKFSKGDTLQAENIFSEVLIRDPNSVDALFNLGALAERRGDLPSALSDYKKALNLDSSDQELKQAVASIQEQLAKKSAKPGKGPLFGSANLNKAAPILTGQDPQFSDPILPAVGKLPLVGAVNTNTNTGQVQPMYVPTLGVRPHGKKGLIKGVIGIGLSAGFMAVPYAGPLHCPICRMVGGF